MTSFEADASAQGQAFTENGDLVTGSASATATSSFSYEDASKNAHFIANNIAGKQALTAAQIISQAENIIFGNVNQYIKPSNIYANSVAVGYGTENTNQNQIQLGDANTSVVIGVLKTQTYSVSGDLASSSVDSNDLPPIPDNPKSTIGGDQVVTQESYLEGNVYAYQNVEIQDNLIVYGDHK